MTSPRHASKVVVGLPHWAVSGPCVFAERLVRGLRGRGWDASVLLTEDGCLKVPAPAGPASPPADIPCLTLPVRPDDPWGVRFDAIIRTLETSAPCHYLMLHDWRNNVVAPRLSDRVTLVGLLQADSELDFEQAGRLGPFWNAIVAVADPLQFSFAHRFPHLAHRAITIRNCVPDLPEPPAKPQTGPLRIAYSGELRRTQKRLDDMIAVSRALTERGIPHELTLYGDGEYRTELEALAAPLVAAGTVRFAGRLPAACLPDEMADQHVFLLTSQFEGLSIALLEAMSRGCVPVVSELVTQSLVVRDRLNALTCPVGDIGSFVGNLARLAGDPTLRERLGRAAFETIRTGGHRIDDMLDGYEALFARLDAQVESGAFRRSCDWLRLPPERVGTTEILTALPGDPCGRLALDLDFINAVPVWPGRPSPPVAHSQPPARPMAPPPPFESHKVIVSAAGGQISGVDTFTIHLLRRLRGMGIDARVHGSRELADRSGLAIAADIPVDPRETPAWMGWPQAWQSMIDHLESQAPCIYIPNYDYEYSCIVPRLSARVRVVTICHSDDPMHYEHTARLAHASDGIVAVSSAIRRHLEGLLPSLAGRMHTIPYGIPRIDTGSSAVRPPEGVLRVAYVGRLMRYQKRANDVVAIAAALDRRGIPFEMLVVGDGPERTAMEQEGRRLVMRRKLAFLGTQPNDDVLDLLGSCDAFLLPSAFEGLSVGMLEAMSRGAVPVVSAIRSGVPDVIRPGENGLVAPIGDIEAFADRLALLQADPQARARMAAEAMRTIRDEGYLVDTMFDRYLALFRAVAAAPSLRLPGPVVPPAHLRGEGTLAAWARRVASDPLASAGRVVRRLTARSS